MRRDFKNLHGGSNWRRGCGEMLPGWEGLEETAFELGFRNGLWEVRSI